MMMAEPPFVVEALFLPAKPKAEDPLGQYGYLAIKASGGAQARVLKGDVHTAFIELRDNLVAQVEKALLAALQAPDTNASA